MIAYHEALFARVLQSDRMKELAQRTNLDLAYLNGAGFMKAMDDTSRAVLAAKRDA